MIDIIIPLLTTHFTLLASFIVGTIGSLAYYTALSFGFIGGNSYDRRIILKPFRHKRNFVLFLKIIWYSFFGGCFAVIFQIPQGLFVPVQSLIIGVSWPSIIIPLLSGRMSEPSKDDRINQLVTQVTAIKNAKKDEKGDEKIEKMREEILKKIKGGK